MQIITLAPGITLRCFPSSLFKQSALTIQFLDTMCRERASLNALLPAVLLRGCRTAPDMRAITLKLDDLYGAAVGALSRRVGDYQATGLSCGFIEDAYTLEEDGILAPTLEFLTQLLLEPVLEEGVFCKDFVENEKKNLISAIESTRNNKRTYANMQLLKAMCREDSFGIPQYGEPEQVAAITAESLYAHYQQALSTCPVNIFYVGSAQPEKIADLLMPLANRLAGVRKALPAQTPFTSCPGSHSREKMAVTQGKLCMGYVTDITIRDERFAAMQVLNTLLGGGMTCKLFMQVREKLSLCYDIHSAYHGSKGLVIVNAGIDFDREEQVRQEVEHQLQLCKGGQITPQELAAAKEQLISQLQAVHDSPGAIENYYATGALSGMHMTPKDYEQAVQAVTAQAVQKAAQTLQLHSSYFLTGEDTQ